MSAHFTKEGFRKLVFRFRVVALTLLAVHLIGCGTPERPIKQNEPLRLTREDVGAYTRRAQLGDADAAMKLWQHYDFAEKDYSKGAYWKSRYDKLRQNAKGTK